MKNYKTILNQINKNNETIKAMDARIESLSYTKERHDACGDYETLKKYHVLAKNNAEEIKILSDAQNALKLENAILCDNCNASIFEDILPAIVEIMTPYEGKKYGERTREKIREEANKRGFGFYFDGHFTESNTITAYMLDIENKYHHSGNKTTEIRFYCDYKTPFITNENTIQILKATENGIKNPYAYTENVKTKAKQIKKAFDQYYNALETARNAESKLNAIMPRCKNHFHKAGSVNYYELY